MSNESNLYYFYTVGCGFCKKAEPIVDELNKNIDIPLINEKMEEKGLNVLYDVFEEKIKSAMKKAL